MSAEPEKGPEEKIMEEHKEPKETPTTSEAKYCLECNFEMSMAKTELKVDGWVGHKPPVASADTLPVVIYFCLQCGKIELKADSQENKD